MLANDRSFTVNIPRSRSSNTTFGFGGLGFGGLRSGGDLKNNDTIEDGEAEDDFLLTQTHSNIDSS